MVVLFTIWFLVGGLYDLKYMFVRLQRDEHDDGTVH
jgi:hypothetical protein